MKLGRLFALSVAFIGLVAAPAICRADFIVVEGNVPQVDENVLLASNNVGANTIFGTTNQTGTAVEISSAGQLLTSPSSGQARVKALSGDLLGIDSISLVDATFTSLIFNLNSGSGQVTITVNGFDFNNTPESEDFVFNLGNGSNFFTITAINGERITSVGFTSPGGVGDVRQIRIGGAQAVPEPASLAMLGLGMGAVGMVRRRRAAKV